MIPPVMSSTAYNTSVSFLSEREKLPHSQKESTYRFEVLRLLDRALHGTLHVRHHPLRLSEDLETSRAAELDFGVHIQQMLFDALGTPDMFELNGVAGGERAAVFVIGIVKEQVRRVVFTHGVPPTGVEQQVGRLALLFVAFLEDGLGHCRLRHRHDIAEESTGSLLGSPGSRSHEDAFGFGGASR